MSDQKPFRVLIVDDDELARKVYAKQLTKLGASTIVECPDGAQVAQVIGEQEPFDIILCDLMLPGADGVELLRTFSTLSPRPSVILVSSSGQNILDTAQQIAEGRDLNILGALQKPVLAETLRKAVSRLGSPAVGRRGAVTSFEVTESELRAAIAGGEIQIFVQPKLDMVDGRLCGVEALARWISPSRGIVPPSAFIALAERCGLMESLTDVVFDRALRACEHWNSCGLKLQVSINVSMSSLTNLDFPKRLIEKLERHRLDPSQIVLEITESTLLENLVESLDVLTRLRLKRIGLSIDDFGTGYSSLLQLRRIPFTELKIDRAFASSVMADSAALSIIQSCIQLARSMNLTVVAEGIESRNEWDLLRGLGCDQAQGYLIAKPMPVERLVEWADAHKGRPDLAHWGSENSSSTPTLNPDLQETAFERLFQFSHDAIVLVDGAGRITRCNARATAMFGYMERELLGQAVEMLVSPLARHEHANSRSRFYASPKMRLMGARDQLLVRRRDGTEIPVDILLSPVKSEEGPLTLAVISHRHARQT